MNRNSIMKKHAVLSAVVGAVVASTAGVTAASTVVAVAPAVVSTSRARHASPLLAVINRAMLRCIISWNACCAWAWATIHW